MQNHRSDKPPPPRSILTHSALCKFFFASPHFLPLFWRTLCRYRSIRAVFLRGGALCRYRSIRAWGAPYRQSRYGTPAATLLPASGQYAPLSPYCLRQCELSCALCRYRSIRARGRPIGKADTGRLRLRYCPQAANTLRYRPIACGNTGSRALCRYRSIRARGAAEAAVAVVKNCSERDEWPLQSSSMDDCMTNAKKSSKEPPVVRVPSCTYSHALQIQAQAPSSLRRPTPALTTK